VVPYGGAVRLRLLDDTAGGVEKILGDLLTHLVHAGAGQEAALFQLALKVREAIDLVLGEVGPGGGGVAVEAGDLRFKEEGAALGTHVVHGLLELVVGLLGVVAVDDAGADAEGLAPVGDVFLAVLGAGGGGDAPAVVGDQHEDGKFGTRAAGPDQAGGEVALGGAGVAALDNGDALAVGALLGHGGARGDGELNLDGGGDGDHVPGADGGVTGEVATAGVGVGGGVLHLPEGIHGVGAHGEERAGGAVVEVEVIVVEAASLADQEAERDVEGLLAGAADPEEAVALLVHADQPLLEDARGEHQLVDLELERRVEGGRPIELLRERWGNYLGHHGISLEVAPT
jgi:hypothetical protein